MTNDAHVTPINVLGSPLEPCSPAPKTAAQPHLMQGWKLEHSYTSLPEHFFTRISPTPVREPKLVIFNHALAQSLGLGFKKTSDNPSENSPTDIKDGSTITLLSDGQQSPPKAGWVVLLYEGSEQDGYRWTLYGIKRAQKLTA